MAARKIAPICGTASASNLAVSPGTSLRRVSHGNKTEEPWHISHMGDLRQHLKAAVEATPVPLALETRVLSRVRAAAPRRRPLLPPLGVLVTVALLVTVY